jgi:hypothetical protein
MRAIQTNDFTGERKLYIPTWQALTNKAAVAGGTASGPSNQVAVYGEYYPEHLLPKYSYR